MTNNDYYKALNERFDKRVEKLLSLGYKYYKEYVCFAKNVLSAKIYGINNAVIMHCDDFHFNNITNK